MARRKRKFDLNVAKKFTNDTLSTIVKDKEEELYIRGVLENCGLNYSIGEIPKMLNGKVVGCLKQITVLNGERLKEITRENERT